MSPLRAQSDAGPPRDASRGSQAGPAPGRPVSDDSPEVEAGAGAHDVAGRTAATGPRADTPGPSPHPPERVPGPGDATSAFTSASASASEPAATDAGADAEEGAGDGAANGAAADADLVERVRSSCDPADARAAATMLIERYQRRVAGLCLRMTGDRDQAADLAQEAFVRVLTGLSRFDGRAALSTWIYSITVNVCLAELRKTARRRSLAPMTTGHSVDAPGRAGTAAVGSARAGTAESAESREPEATSRIEMHEDRVRLRRALQSLEPEARALLLLRDGQGLGLQAIATALEMPVGTVKSRLFRARIALREHLESMEHPGETSSC